MKNHGGHNGKNATNESDRSMRLLKIKRQPSGGKVPMAKIKSRKSKE